MIQELKIRNFLSFKDEVTFSFEATADKTLDDYYVTEVVPGVRLLKMAMVYGANASGKSNLIEAIAFLKQLFFTKRESKNEGTDFIPFMFGDSKDQRGIFELLFYVGSTKYKYHLELDRNKILVERLHYYPGTQPAILFLRSYNADNDASEIAFGSKIKIDKAIKDELKAKLLKNVSFFISHDQVNYTQPQFDEVYNWFANKFLDPITPEMEMTDYTTEKIKSNPLLQEFALRFMKNAQYNIADIKIDTQNEPLSKEVLSFMENSNMPEATKEKLRKDGLPKNILSFEHEIKINDKIEQHELPEHLQSEGTMRYYSFSAPIYKTFNQNAFLCIDELESKLHSHLVKHLVREFLMESRKYPDVQFLFTTHDTSLLSEKDMLRKDAIWFTEKLENGSTDLYSMSDFDIRKELSYYNAYNLGKFGAVPNLD